MKTYGSMWFPIVKRNPNDGDGLDFALAEHSGFSYSHAMEKYERYARENPDTAKAFPLQRIEECAIVPLSELRR